MLIFVQVIVDNVRDVFLTFFVYLNVYFACSAFHK